MKRRVVIEFLIEIMLLDAINNFLPSHDRAIFLSWDRTHVLTRARRIKIRIW